MGATITDTYQSALSYLYGFIDYERTARWKYDTEHFNLDRVRDYLAVLGSPHRHGWFVHIAGTNGKGSVAAMIAKALSCAGYKTGLYTSPHLISFRERIRINGCSMTHEDVVEGVERIRDATDRFKGLTFFEVWTALAFDHFRRKEVDVSVIEVGMGGRLDTTNVIEPDVAVITSVSMDHAGILGSTPAEIALEKAGIIKTGLTVVSSPQTEDVLDVLVRTARGVNADFILTGKDVQFTGSGKKLSYHGLKWTMNDISIPLDGRAQYENTATALAAVEVLSGNCRTIGSDHVRNAVETVLWPGRLQIIARQPDVIVDGACNVGAMKEVCGFMSARNPRADVVAVIAMCRDKEIAKVLDVLGTCASRFVVTQVSNPRALETSKLAVLAPPSVDVTLEPDVGKALDTAAAMAGRQGTVLATGSLYLVGDVMKQFGIKNIDCI